MSRVDSTNLGKTMALSLVATPCRLPGRRVGAEGVFDLDLGRFDLSRTLGAKAIGRSKDPIACTRSGVNLGPSGLMAPVFQLSPSFAITSPATPYASVGSVVITPLDHDISSEGHHR